MDEPVERVFLPKNIVCMISHLPHLKYISLKKYHGETLPRGENKKKYDFQNFLNWGCDPIRNSSAIDHDKADDDVPWNPSIRGRWHFGSFVARKTATLPQLANPGSDEP